MHLSSSPVVGVPGETGLLLAGASAQCRPPHCEPQAAAGVAAPSCFAPLHFPVASLPDPQQVQSVLGSAIENLRCLWSAKADIHYFVMNKSVRYNNPGIAMTPDRSFFTVIMSILMTKQIQRAKYWYQPSTAECAFNQSDYLSLTTTFPAV